VNKPHAPRIESGVEMPERNNQRYPLGEMEPGDSFFLPDTEQRTRIQSAVSWHGKRNGRKYSIRTVDGGFRVWRLS
jgi:hypothetical protein